ncbi:DUF2796 domain-containing protein [Paraglaciecola mesophila]|uniref:DUF2796 domain-containing protein n=1 Tax=Paraglaciecola mesophila TaxID=197222 RepID=A0ABU9SZS4_9ALTE
MIKNVLLLSALFSCCNQAVAQAHQHGQGQLFISQEENEWHMQFILPAADVLGFEHAPEDAQQKKALQSLIKRLNQNEGVVDLSGRCSLREVTHSLRELSLFEDHENGGNDDHHGEEPQGGGSHDSDRHEDDHHNDHNAHHALTVHEEHNASENHHDDNHDDEHKDVEVEYHFACDASNKKLSVTLFQWLPSLSRIHAQWITDTGQGTAILTPVNPDVEW